MADAQNTPRTDGIIANELAFTDFTKMIFLFFS